MARKRKEITLWRIARWALGIGFVVFVVLPIVWAMLTFLAVPLLIVSLGASLGILYRPIKI